MAQKSKAEQKHINKKDAPFYGRVLACFLRQYRTILSADTASEVRQMLSQKRR